VSTPSDVGFSLLLLSRPKGGYAAMIPKAEVDSGAVRRRARAARASARLIGPLVAAAVWGTALATARAELVFEMGPAASVGWTDNAANAPTDLPSQADEFASLSVTGRVHYRGSRTDQALGYRFSATRYLHLSVLDTLSQELAWVSTYNLTAQLDLTLGASAMLARLTSYTFDNPALGGDPQAVRNGNLEYLSTTATQGLKYSPTARHHYLETFQVTRVAYLSGSLPVTIYAAGDLRAAWDAARDTGTLELTVSDTYVPTYTPVPSPTGAASAPLPASETGQRLFVQLLGGWKRDLSPTWSVDASLGALVISDLSGDGFWAPAGIADLVYRRFTWFATLSVSQTTAPNFFIGGATLNDQAIARLTLPLNHSELLFVGGYASYTYARVADDSAHEKVFDLTSVGASLTAHARRSPLWGSLDYAFAEQHGSSLAIFGDVPTRRRQVVLVTIGGSFDFGPGTPPLFRGGVL
jgi:hypothetical protein